jgi:leader peptidase (prepilin peptidase)/N-methyltransferase
MWRICDYVIVAINNVKILNNNERLINMPGQAAFFPMLLLIFILTLLLSKILAMVMQVCLQQAVSLLAKPENIRKNRTRRGISLFFLLFPLYVLSYYVAADIQKLFLLWIFIAFMVFISIMDFEQQIILDKVVLCLLLAALVFAACLPETFINRLFAALAGGAVFLLLAVITKGGIGGGDIKLIFALGLWLGADKLLFTVLFGCLSAGVISVLLLLGKIKKPQDTIAYGPYFALSAIIALLI